MAAFLASPGMPLIVAFGLIIRESRATLLNMSALVGSSPALSGGLDV